ncbi:Rqc2 family fibronectin-binding protein [Vacuolonema iberomarrocanum]|uniref:Rqc2 family fibronectin-binding protein n=1 Tax=Vacuolonema iberomarrocanum TaxID=3454632 RepID=UPI001A05A152|nr:NFACT family protein [filamentous cyanobacterium LEGE 07170]
MQSVDFTTLTALCAELRSQWLPARLEQVYQRDRHTIVLSLRTLEKRGWLTVSWHPQAARICMDDPPPRTPDTFTFSQQLRHQINGLALVAIDAIAPWERALDLQFSRRPGDPPQWHLYVEVMNKYSNVILTTAGRQIVTVAHQVNTQQSSVRPLLTGQPYEFPPALTETIPRLEESQATWQERLQLVPIPLRRAILQNYRGLSSALVREMGDRAQVDVEQPTDQVSDRDWQAFFQTWQEWLTTLIHQSFQPGWKQKGYTVMGWGESQPADSVQEVVGVYYREQLNRQEFEQLRNQLSQRVGTNLRKLRERVKDFQTRLQQSDDADRYKERADLLMAHLHQWQPGMDRITLADFETGEPTEIPLDPEKNAVQNAQAFYKRHQKLRRSRQAIEPLLAEVQGELAYVEQVQVAIAQTPRYQDPNDLEALHEIRDELIQQGYLTTSDNRSRPTTEPTPFREYRTPSGFSVLVGRNNRQNDDLTFRFATDYDLWFHSQEIPGSHVLLRLPAGAAPENTDLQYTANLAAYHSRATQSNQVPVVYTEPRYVFKPKGAKPGMALYKNETVIWGEPQTANQYQPTSENRTG